MSLEANKFIRPDNIQLQLDTIGLIKSINNKYEEEIKEDNTIDGALLSRFKTLYNNFTYVLFEFTTLVDNYVQDTDKTKKNYLDYFLSTPVFANKIDNIVSTWNQIVIFLISKLKYEDLSRANKSYIDNKFTQLAPAVSKITRNFEQDIEDGSARITSQNFPSKLLFSNLFELVKKLSEPDFTLIKFKGDIGEEAPLDEEEEEGDEPEEPEEPEERSARSLRAGLPKTSEPEYIRESKIRKAIERYSKVNPRTSLMTQRAYEDISSFFRVPPSEDEYMTALRGIRPQSERARTDRNVAQASRDSQSEYYRTLADLKRGLERSLDLARETREILQN